MNRALSGLFIALVIASAPLAMAASGHTGRAAPPPIAPCGCYDIPEVEQQLRDQKYLQALFSEWAGYMPAAILTVPAMQDRAVTLLQLTFYGARSQAPQKNTG